MLLGSVLEGAEADDLESKVKHVSMGVCVGVVYV